MVDKWVDQYKWEINFFFKNNTNILYVYVPCSNSNVENNNEIDYKAFIHLHLVKNGLEFLY